jgi:hypothetical protein
MVDLGLSLRRERTARFLRDVPFSEMQEVEILKRDRRQGYRG